MKTMRLICAASILALTLSIPTFAGDIHFGITQPPPPPSSPVTSQGIDPAGTEGDIHTGVTDDESLAPPVVEAALSLARAVLALF